jgi:hypothetical protein
LRFSKTRHEGWISKLRAGTIGQLTVSLSRHK